MEIKIEIIVNAGGYSMVVSKDDEQIEHTTHKYMGNGRTDCVFEHKTIDDYELDDKLDDISMALDDIMYYIQKEEEAEDEGDE